MLSRMFLTGLIVLAVSLVACVPYEETKPASVNAEYHYIMGVTALDEHNPTDALKEFLLAEESDPRDPQIQSGLAQAYWLKQAHDLAEKHFKNAIELSDSDPQYYHNLAALYLSMERYDDSINAFKTAAENLLFDRPEQAWTAIGLANFQKQDYPAAERSYRKAMSLNSRYYLAPFHLGELYYSQERPVEALDMFTLAVGLAPEFSNGHYWQGLVYMKTKEIDKAKQSFKEVVRLAPLSETARLASNYLKIINK
jgi:type IV pilus assembly protein PilF